MDVDFSTSAPLPPSLAELVDAFWHQPAPAESVERAVIPDGCVDVIVECAEGVAASAFVFGPTVQRADVVLERGVTYAGVRLKPWIGAPLLGAAGEELCERVVDLRELLPSSGRWIERATPTTATGVLRELTA